jgi:FMN reductase
VANAVADAVASGLGIGQSGAERLVVDLAEHAGQLFDWGAEQVSALNTQVASSDIVVVASPTYKATYTGMLKAFLDRYGNNGLARTVAVPVMTGASPLHALAPEVHLRPLLVELGASLPTRGLYVVESQLAELDAVVTQWADVALPNLGRALHHH